MNVSTEVESLTKIPLANVSSCGSSNNELGVFDNVLQEWDRDTGIRSCWESITITLSPVMQHDVCHMSYTILQQSTHHKKLDGESLLINCNVEQLKNQLP